MLNLASMPMVESHEVWFVNGVKVTIEPAAAKVLVRDNSHYFDAMSEEKKKWVIILQYLRHLNNIPFEDYEIVFYSEDD